MIALIDKYNLEKSKEFEVFKPIANLTKHRKAKKVSTTADNTFDNTSSVDSAKWAKFPQKRRDKRVVKEQKSYCVRLVV